MLSEKTRRLARERNFAVLTTLMPDGIPQSHVMWIDHDSEHILVNTEVHRQKFKNLQRNPLATVTIIDSADSYSYVEVRGRVIDTVTGDLARQHIDDLSVRYLGRPYDSPIKSERVILKIAPDKEVIH